MNLADFTFTELSNEMEFGHFDCNEEEINDFLFEDSKDYQNQKLANTYLFIDDNNNHIAAYFCISNDCLTDRGHEKGYTNKIFNRLHRRINLPNQKRIRQYPAVKVGRLGVDNKYQKTGIAYDLMLFIKGFVIKDQKPACRLLLLDALNKERQIKFYKKNNFEFLLDEDENNENRIMYFDLLQLS